MPDLLSPDLPDTLAAIDLGSNGFPMIVARISFPAAVLSCIMPPHPQGELLADSPTL